ncbi:MAG: hypothetical protein KDI60_07120 [Xanthomonadales bacterium]|nr:hypothetical protein [Xanthomonadales bacterium]MCB1611513.1 hypothetical protein [Xanthomonadales bacterium]
MLNRKFILRKSRICWTFTSALDLVPPNNRGWFFYSVKPASGGRFSIGDFVCVAPKSPADAVVTVVRQGAIVLTAEVSGGMPAGQSDFYWLSGTESKTGHHVIVYRDIEIQRSSGLKAGMHVEIFNPNGQHTSELPWVEGNVSYPSLRLSQILDDPGAGIPGEPEQDDEGSGEEP